MPGPNDYHVTFADDDTEKKVPIINEGLGKDEPSESQRAGARSAAVKRLEELKKEVADAGDALTEKERAIAIREQALEARERELVAALAAQARAAGNSD